MRMMGVVAAVIAVSQAVDAQQRRTYGRGTVVVAGERFQAERLVILGDTLTFVVRGSGQPKSYPLSRVEYASRIRSHAREGALVGGGLMLLGALLGVAEAGADPNLETRENAGAITAGLTAGGVLLGALIGSAFHQEKSIIQNGRLMADIRSPVSSGDSRRARFGVRLRL